MKSKYLNSDFTALYKWLISVCGLIILLFTPFRVSLAEEQPVYRHIAFLGIDSPLSNSEVNTPAPIFGYYYIRDDLPDEMYFQFTTMTTMFYFITAYKTDIFFTGIKPVLNHTIYSAYHNYTDGVNDDTRCFNGNNGGAEFFYEYSFYKYLKTMISYYPGYYWYQKKEKSDFIFTEQGTTEIALPENHMEHSMMIDVTIDKTVKKDIERIKHGFMLQGTYKYIYRRGYKTFYDDHSSENTSIDRTSLRYLAAGVYYNFENDINLMFDIYGACHSNVDRNNADKIGSYTADKGIMPGYFWGEFYHNKYCIGRVQIGIPLFVWGARIQPSANILYMPRNNDVAGVENYPRRIYRSVSTGLSMKAGGVLPLFFDYAYGFDARRLNTATGVLKKGNHEIMCYVLGAF